MSDASNSTNLWSVANTIMLIIISILGFFARYWMETVDKRLAETVGEIRRLNNELISIQTDVMYERGRSAGIKEGLKMQDEPEK